MNRSKSDCCPWCGNNSLSVRWTDNRKLQKYCKRIVLSEDGSIEMDCEWVGKPYTPKKKKIVNTLTVAHYGLTGYDYLIYDKYGHILITSKSYSKEKEARKAMMAELKKGNSDKFAGPYTGVLFYIPPTVTFEGKVFKLSKKNK